MKKTPHHRLPALALGVAALLLLQACGTTSVSKGISDEGKASEVIFPDMGTDAWLKEGTFPNLDNLRTVAPGVTKDQLYDLLGRPHFREGMAGPREWDYIFHFRKPGGGVTTCQYKAIFDTDYKAQTFHWLPAGCGELLAVRPAAVPVAAAAAVAPVARMTTLGADGLFRFDGSQLGDLQPEGRAKVEALAANLRGNLASIKAIRITGHTDRLGAEAYNQALSLARANTVRELLVQHGVASGLVQTVGLGETQPVVADCKGNASSPALVACLQPNRRVDIEVSASQ